jgi:hypothetical protein
MEYLYVNFSKDIEIMTGGGVYTGTKLFLFNDADFPEAAAIKVTGLSGLKTNIMNMFSIDGKLSSKGYYVDSTNLKSAKLIIGTSQLATRRASLAGYKIALNTILSFMKNDKKVEIQKAIDKSYGMLPMTITLDNEPGNFINDKDNTSLTLLENIKRITGLPLNTVVLVTFGTLSNTVTYVKKFTNEEISAKSSSNVEPAKYTSNLE